MSASKIEIYSNGTLVSTTAYTSKFYVSSQYYMIAGEGGSAFNTFISSGGSMLVDGGEISKTQVCSGGVMQVKSGIFGKSATTVRSGGYLEILGSGNNFLLNSGRMTVAPGGTATDVRFAGTASAIVSSGGKMSDAKIIGGELSVLSGGITEKIVVSRNGKLIVEDGAVASGVSHAEDGALVYVQSGGVLYNLINDGAETIVSSGGVVSRACLNCYTKSGSIESPIPVEYHASMTLKQGAVCKGAMVLNDSYVFAENGSIIDFTMVGFLPGKDVLINDYSCINGTPDYTMTVSETQQSGTYNLANKAQSFNSEITVITAASGEAEIPDRTISKDETIVCNNKFFTLGINTGNTLTLVIGDRVAVSAGKTFELAEDVSQAGKAEAYAGSGGAIEVLTGGTLTNSEEITFDHCSATGNGGAILNNGNATLGQMTFSHNSASQGGAVYNGESGVLNIDGYITLATDSDTIVNNGIINWDITDGSASNTDFSVSDWTLVSGSGICSVTVDTIDAQYGSDYQLAQNVKSAFTVNLKRQDSVLQTLTVDSSKTSADFVSADGGYYTLNLTTAGEIVLSARSLCIYNESKSPEQQWKEGDAVSYTFNGTTISGTVGDGTFFVDANDAAAEITNRNGYGVAANRDYSKSVGGNGLNALISEGDYSRMYFGGSILTENSSLAGSFETLITGGEFADSIAAGDAANGNCQISRDGDLTTAIEGGTFSKRVAGGMYYGGSEATGSVELYDDVNFTISDGVFNGRIFGGSNAKNETVGSCTYINGDINLTVTTDVSHQVTINECLVAGSRSNGIIAGSVNVTFTGNGQYLTFGDNSVVFGGCNGDTVKISKKGKEANSSVGVNSEAQYRNLVFSDFSGSFGAEIRLFGTATFKNDSNVQFTDKNLDLWAVEIWNFEFGSTASGVAANEFSGDTLNFDMTGYDDGVWNVLSGSTDAFSDLEKAKAVSFGESEAKYDEKLGCWTDGVYKLALNEAKNGMEVSKLA